MNRIKSANKPDICESLGNGIWYYNYDIIEEETDGEPIYSWVLIRVNGRPTYKTCAELIIREYISQTEEFDLINSANRSILAGETVSEDIDKYKKYLLMVSEIKEKIASDLGK